MRIVAGKARGRQLATPRGTDTRPTSDRVREAIFNILGQWTDGLRVLDLYAGTGALGLEAVSRGAAAAVLVDASRDASRLCRENAAALGFLSQVRVMQLPVARALTKLDTEGARFDLIFADPPYAARAGGATLEALVGSKLLAEGARVVLEHERREEVPAALGPLIEQTRRLYGDTVVRVFGPGQAA